MILSFAQLATEEFWEKVMGLLNERVPLRPAIPTIKKRYRIARYRAFGKGLLRLAGPFVLLTLRCPKLRCGPAEPDSLRKLPPGMVSATPFTDRSSLLTALK
jgi:hypothetical protein